MYLKKNAVKENPSPDDFTDEYCEQPEVVLLYSNAVNTVYDSHGLLALQLFLMHIVNCLEFTFQVLHIKWDWILPIIRTTKTSILHDIVLETRKGGNTSQVILWGHHYPDTKSSKTAPKNSPCEHRHQNPQQNVSRLNPTIYKEKNIT